MKVKSICILMAYLLLFTLSVPAEACCDPPPCSGCCDCVDDVCVDDDTECNENGCYECENCECEYKCTGNTCCDGSGNCVTPNTSWVTTGGWTVEVPAWVKTKANAAINSIPGVSGVEVTEDALTITAKKRECCDPPIKYEKCADGAVSLSANLGSIQLYGGSFEYDVHFGSWQATVTITANGHC